MFTAGRTHSKVIVAEQRQQTEVSGCSRLTLRVYMRDMQGRRASCKFSK